MARAGAGMILAVDTSGAVAVVAAVDDLGQLLFGAAGQTPRAHGEELAPLAARALRAGNLTRVVVGRGPGSFTGLRVGLAFGQVLAFAAAVPATGICSLDVVARQSGLTDGTVVMDARRGEVYLAAYRAGVRAAPPRVLPRAQAAQAVAGRPVAGDVALLGTAERRAAGTTRLEPGALGLVAYDTVVSGADEGLQPLYLRRPDVTMSAANRGGPR